jgi:pimeloyl-ACP methyl ester carboxylesterase
MNDVIHYVEANRLQFAYLDDWGASAAYGAAALAPERVTKLFILAIPTRARSNIVEEVPGGHFMHREHPDAFAERLLKYL